MRGFSTGAAVAPLPGAGAAVAQPRTAAVRRARGEWRIGVRRKGRGPQYTSTSADSYPNFDTDMPFSEVAHEFDDARPSLAPYGLTCVRWRARPMQRTDRHNKIELNHLETG